MSRDIRIRLGKISANIILKMLRSMRASEGCGLSNLERIQTEAMVSQSIATTKKLVSWWKLKFQVVTTQRKRSSFKSTSTSHFCITNGNLI